MPFEFPTAPVTGDIFSDATSGAEYVYTGSVWDLKSGGAMTDYVLKAGDTMTGPLTLPEIVGPSSMTGTFNLMTGDIEAKTGIIVARANHIYTQGGGRFIWNNTDNNAWQNAISFNGGIHLQYHQGGNNDGRMRIWTSNGGYSDTWVMETTIVSGYPGINVNGNLVARQLVNRDGTHIRAAEVDGYGIQFYSGAHIYKAVGTGLVIRKHSQNTQIQIEQNDGSGRVAIATTALVRGDMLVEDQIEERVAPLLARLAALEAEIATLKAQPRAPDPPRPQPPPRRR